MARRPAGPDPVDPEQERLLKEAKQMVTVQAFQMKRALDQQPPNLMEALKHASNMINELRTGLLSPKSYEELYRLCFDQLRHLETFLSDAPNRGRSLLELYQLVQYAGNILPRMYLLITVGSVYIRSLEAPANDIIYDLVELCRGVQHPTRGLFLRNYLSEMTKDTLPDEGSQFAGEVTDSIDFIVANFTEMNKLWDVSGLTRALGPIRSPEQRERERSELSLLVGKNLQRLSQLEGLTLGLYKSDVLPRILTQIVQCRDRISQQYLMDIIIQVFSDDFHLRTLDQLLGTCLQLVDEVDVPSIIASLISRLAKYCEGNKQAIPEDLDMFKLFTEYADKLVRERPDSKLSLSAVINLDLSLIQLALRVYDGDATKLDALFNVAHEHIVKKGGLPPGTDRESRNAITAALSLLRTPLSHLRNARRLLTLKNVNKIVDNLPTEQRKRFAMELIENLLQNETTIPVPEEVDALFAILSPLVKTSDADKDLGPEDWEEEQNKVAYAIAMLQSPEIDSQFLVLLRAYEHVSGGGVNRIKVTLPPLIFRALHLVQRIIADKNARNEVAQGDEEAPWEKKLKRIFKFANDAVGALKAADLLQLAFRLYIECALAAGKVQLKNFAYGFLTKGAIAIYEEDAMAQSRMEYDAIRLLIGAVNALDCFDEESYSFLATRLAQHSSKLLNLDDQSRAVELSAHLFISKLDGGKGKYEATDRLLSCLKKAMTVAGNIHEADVMIELLVDLLDRFLFYYDTMPSVVDVSIVNALVKKIAKHFTISSLPSTHPALVHFANVKQHVQLRGWKDIQF